MCILKKIIYISSCFGFLHIFCSQVTDGFAFWKIHSCVLPGSMPEKENLQLQPLLNQPFFYLAHGAQSFAFLSKDGNYVLKFYRQDRATHPLAFSLPLLPKKYKTSLLQTLNKRKNKQLKTFSSYHLAYTHLCKETGLLYLHLYKTTHLQQKVRLYDKLGIVHEIDLDTTAFLLQHKAKPVYLALEEWIQQKELQKAKDQITALIHLLITRAKKGLADKDPDLQTNFGFISEGPIQFDVGRYTVDPLQADPKIYKEHLIRMTDKLYTWLEKKEPSLAKHMKDCLKDVVTDSFTNKENSEI